MLQRLYDRVLGLAAHRHALAALAVVSFVESSVFPIPPDVLLIPMVLAAPARAWRVAGVCTLASVLGALLGYAIGFYLFEAVGRPMLEFYGYGGQFSEFQGFYKEWGVWIVAGAALTPFPFKVITIASGVMGLDLATFVLASLLARGVRFYAEAALLMYFGPPVKELIERNLSLAATVFFILLLGGFVLVRYAL